MPPLNFYQASEPAIGANHPIWTDSINRALKEVLLASGCDPNASFPGFLRADSPLLTGAWEEWVVVPGYNLAAPDTAWNGVAFSRHLPAMWAAGNPAAVWRLLGSVVPVFRIVDDLQVLDCQPAAAAGGSREVFTYFSPQGATTYAHDFQQALPPQVGVPVDAQRPLSLELMAWIRKKSSGALPGARQFFGIMNFGDHNWSRRIARIGLAGDGVGGFRFQSNNCSSAPAGATENLQTDVDANSAQPAALVAPAANWFHVRLKLVSAIDGLSGRLYCFLNGTLAATFASPGNMPIQSRSSIDVLQANYWPLVAAVALWGDPDTVTVDPGLYIRDLRVRLRESWDAS